MSDNKTLGKKIIEAAGGAENIQVNYKLCDEIKKVY